VSDAEGHPQTAFERLHPAIQYHVVNSLGWPGLRALQEQSVDPIIAGNHALLLAPTAGGKTEAAMLPVLSRMVTEEWRGVSVLYVCPIKALLNNLEPRLTTLAGFVGRTVRVWHGDVGQGDKKRAERELPDILLTTPESLEGILIGSRRDHERLLSGVRCVVIDELHAFAGDDRGWHLLALLERIQRISKQPLQRVAMSATVGAPQALLDWLAAHVEGERTLVHIQGPAADADLRVDYVGSISNAAILISQLHLGEKRLVFCDSRSRVEELSLALRSLGVDVYVSHAALSADTRRQAEQAFAERQNCVIVATSTLELGLDVGDLDRVIQIDAPSSVASFLQRIGRTGRRSGSTRNMLFIATRDEGLLESLAIVQLFRNGYVEPVTSPPLPFHVLVQQLFAMLFEHGRSLPEASFLTTLGRIPGFASMLDEAWAAVRDHLVESGYLIRDGLILSLGEKSERMFQGKGLADLCVSFDSPASFSAIYGNVSIGNVDPLSLFKKSDGPRILALGGRSWLVTSMDVARRRVFVEPSAEKGASRWMGQARGLSGAIAGQIKRILDDPESVESTYLTKRSTARLLEIVASGELHLAESPVVLPSGGYEWWTYAGLAGNRLLASRIAGLGGTYGAVDSYSLRFNMSTEKIAEIGGWRSVQNQEPAWEAPDPESIKLGKLLPISCLTQMELARVRIRVYD